MEPIDAAADAYESELHAFFDKKQGDPFPGFDLVLLGVGVDGHIASLFPGSPVLEESRRWVAAVPAPEHIGPHLPRLTLTMPVIEASRYVLITTGTKGKEEMLDKVLSLHGNARNFPVFWVQPQGRMSWFIFE